MVDITQQQEEEEEDPLSEDELRSKVKEYIAFIDNTLQPELEKAVSHREEVEKEIHECNELNLQLDTFIDQRNEKRTEDRVAMVDISGCETVYCQARINDPNHIIVDIGKGIHVQLTLEEAKSFCQRRIQFLETHILPGRVKKAQTVASDLEAALSLLESLGKELQSMGK